MIIVIGIIGLLVGAYGKFQADTFSVTRSMQAGITVNTDAERVVKTLAAEIRSMSPASNGSYPIESAATSSLVFYNDIDNDGSRERIRYFLDSANFRFRKGVVKPTGSPLTYNLGNETLTTLVSNVRATTSPIFEYYDESFAGTTTALTLPIDILRVRLIKATLTFDVDPNKSPVPVTITTYAMIRNLKDNH